MKEYVKVLPEEGILLKVMTNSLPTKGNLVYEYNPFRNYRLTENKYWFKESFYSLKELETEFGITLSSDKKHWDGVSQDVPILYEKGQLTDFITDELEFSIDHPVTIVPQYSYDGSVNLILNDGLHIPRLINSRFSATGKNTYEVIDRKGNNDTNIYDLGELFDIDTSLYKRVSKIPKLNFLGVQSGGNLQIGNYHFYFKFADADGNETDFVAESGLVSVFIGFDSPLSIHTGTKNENSTKLVRFVLTNIDDAYNYVTVYYSRNTAELGYNNVTEYKKLDTKYLVNNANFANIVITGFELVIDITNEDINLSYNIVDASTTQAVCLNMLFMANVHKPEIPYEKLLDLSLRFLPYLKEVNYTLDMDLDYHISSTNKGYYDPNFIYTNTGYWGKELYRFGIVYILPNNELSPVFNIRGREKVKVYNDLTNFLSSTIKKTNDGQYTHYFLRNSNGEEVKISTKEDDYYILDPKDSEGKEALDKASFENSKGVVSFDPDMDTDKIYALDVRVDSEVVQELKKYVKGYFFVRLKRIPTILALGITIGIDNLAHTPTIPTCEGFLNQLASSLDGSTYVETKDINDINYISEGFLNRFNFKLKKKSSSIWSKIGKVFAAAAIVTGVVLGSIATFGGVAYSAIALSTSLSFTSFAVSGAAISSAIVGGIAAGITGVAAGIHEGILAILRATAKKELKGRYTRIPHGYKRVEKEESRKLGGDFINRIIIKDNHYNKINAILCPDFSVNLALFNLIFTGNEHLIRTTITLGINELKGYNKNYFSNELRHFYMPSYYDNQTLKYLSCKIIGVPDNTKIIGLDDNKYRSRAGEAEEAWRYEQIGLEYTESEDTKINSDIIRGSFGSYLALDKYPDNPAETVEIMVPGYRESNIEEYIRLRVDDKSPFYAISDRYDIFDMDKNLITPLSQIINNQSKDCGYNYELYRGDCYLCQVTHRIIRNFNDPSAPYNDEIVDDMSWKDNYDPDNTEKYENINLGDVNAVLLGMWVTFKIRSTNNLNIRTLDGSNISETAMTGHSRGYYPNLPMSTEGSYKTAESEIYNKGFSTSVSERWNFELPDVPYIKNWYKTRIMYSDIHINDAYKNGFRTFLGLHYRDYTREYGEIVKLINLNSNLLCVFEHGIALIPVNERAVAGEGSGGNLYINTSNVLPENPKIISDMFGSQWAESVLKVPGKSGNNILYVYGVDTIAKKIWRTDGNTLECISDFRVQEFLNNNITLGERELTPKIGIRNVKTMYNAFKRDVLFTFYDNTYGFEEKVWNLCWNEVLQKFITFYSWVPSAMENINNIPFSFNRETSKWLAKLGTSHTKSSFADGITLSNVILSDAFRKDGSATENLNFPITYLTKQGKYKTITCKATEVDKLIGVLSLSNRTLPQGLYQIHYTLERDDLGNYNNFEIIPIGCTYNNLNYSAETGFQLPDDAMYAGQYIKLEGLRFKLLGDEEYTPIYYKDVSGNYMEINDLYLNNVFTYEPLYTPENLFSELYYRNSAGHIYADIDAHKLGTSKLSTSYVPIDLNAKFDEKDVPRIAEILGIPLEDARSYIGQSKSWVKDEPTLRIFEAIYSPQTIIGFNLPEYNNDNIPKEAYPCTNVGEIRSITTNIVEDLGAASIHGIRLDLHWVIEEASEKSNRKVWYNLPIFKDSTGKRPILPKEEQVNSNKLVSLLNIKAHIEMLEDSKNLSDVTTYKNNQALYNKNSNLIDMGYYESTVAVTPKWNLQFLTSDFWKHGQSGNIDIADDIFPTYWYGKQHPFEFECVVVNDPSVHKIFSNLELVANKAKPESFHYEIIGECYDFAKDKPNMYFRLEAMKALWQYNGADISYNRNFLKVIPRLNNKSADLIHRYYTRLDTINNIEDYYIHVTYPKGHDYKHLSGAEIVYYPNRLEFRIWNHAMAVDLDDLSLDDSRSIIAANCQYLEDRWKVTINPILVCYKNEYIRKYVGSLFLPQNSTWAKRLGDTSSVPSLPSLPIYNSPIPDLVLEKGNIDFPRYNNGTENALYGLYDLSKYGVDNNWKPLDLSNWLTSGSVSEFGEPKNRLEIDLKDKFMKVRIRYSGEELAIIDFLNTVYRISYA